MGGLCALSDVKTILGITNTVQDTKLQLFIDQITEQMVQYVGYQMRRTTYTSERHAINNNQLLMLNGAPIQSVSSVTVNGVAITAGSGDSNYSFDDPSYQKNGILYCGTGWVGNFFTRNMTYDPVAGQHSILVSYVAGWYFPDDVGYVLSDAKSFNVTASVPYGISSACLMEVVNRYRKNVARAEGLTSYSEGGISWGWAKPNNNALSGLNSVGLSDDCCAVLNGWKRYGFA